MFKDNMATGEFAWTPSSGVLPNFNFGNEYIPDPLEGVQHLIEGLGDSEDLSIGTKQVDVGGTSSMGLGNIDLNMPSQQTATVRSGDKRQRVGRTGRRKKGRRDSVTIICDSMNQMARAITSYTSAIVGRRNDETSSIVTALRLLKQLPKCQQDKSFFAKCVHVLQDKDARKWFILMEQADRLAFLDYQVEALNK